MNNLFKNLFKKRNKRVVIVLSLEKLKIAAVILALIGIYAFIQSASFDMNLDCDKKTKMCTISKKTPFDPTPILIHRFDSSIILDINVDLRITSDNKKIYDILINYGTDRGSAYMDYAFTSQIKANTVRTKLKKYLDTNMAAVNISKHCYFNEYFCF